MKKIQKMSTCNRLNLETLGSQLIMPKTLPGHLSANLCPPFQTHEHHHDQDALPYLRETQLLAQMIPAKICTKFHSPISTWRLHALTGTASHLMIIKSSTILAML
jgi:hypothetical protein